MRQSRAANLNLQNPYLDEAKSVSTEVLVSACPWCKSNFDQAVKENGDSVKVMDIAEIISAAL